MACKKYPEGGYEKDREKNISGTWNLSLYEVSGIDSTELINYFGDNYYKEVRIAISSGDISVQVEGIGGSANFVDNNKKFRFSSEKMNSLVCTSVNLSSCRKNYFKPEGGSYLDWTINKLTSNELILSCNLINNYKLKFNK
jgi:hypothetical protein